MNANKQEKKSKQPKAWPILVCFLSAMLLFLLLLNIEKRQLAQYEKGSVVVAIADVAAGREITEKNLAELFAVKERPLTDIPEAAYVRAEDLIGQYVQGGINAGSMVTHSMLGELQKDLGDSVLLGVNMETLAQSVAGTLRAGDVIDIYRVMEDGAEKVVAEKVLGNVTIERSYTSSGIPILKEDDTSIAQYITIPVHQEAVGLFFQSLGEHQIQVVKHP